MANKKGDIVLARMGCAKGEGIYRVELIKPLSVMLGFTVWQVKGLEIIRPAERGYGNNIKPGATAKISERWFIQSVNDIPNVEVRQA